MLLVIPRRPSFSLLICRQPSSSSPLQTNFHGFDALSLHWRNLLGFSTFRRSLRQCQVRMGSLASFRVQNSAAASLRSGADVPAGRWRERGGPGAPQPRALPQADRDLDRHRRRGLAPEAGRFAAFRSARLGGMRAAQAPSSAQPSTPSPRPSGANDPARLRRPPLTIPKETYYA